MTPLPDGHSDTAESQRQVLVVEESPERRQHLCTLLTRHGLAAHAVQSSDLAMEVQGWPGVILVGANDTGRPSGWELAERIRTFDPHVPIVLLGSRYTHPSHTPPTIQSRLPSDTSDERLLQELERCLHSLAPLHHAPSRGRIVLIDDETKLRRILTNFLDLKGFEVLTASSGEDGLRLLERVTPLAVLLDIKMPGMDGIRTLKYLRIRHPDCPVVIISQLDEEQVAQEVGALGVHDYLAKPFNFAHLETTLLAISADETR